MEFFLVLWMITSNPWQDLYIFSKSFPSPETCLAYADEHEGQIKFQAWKSFDGASIQTAACVSKDTLNELIMPPQQNEGESI